MTYWTTNAAINLRQAAFILVRKRQLGARSTDEEEWELRAYFSSGLNIQLMTGTEEACRQELKTLIEQLDAVWQEPGDLTMGDEN